MKKNNRSLRKNPGVDDLMRMPPSLPFPLPIAEAIERMFRPQGFITEIMVVWLCHPCRAQLQGVDPAIQQMFCPACKRPMEFHGPPRREDAIDITAEDTTPRQIAAPESEEK